MSIILKRNELSTYIKDNVLSYLKRDYNLSYNHFDIYKRDNTSIEYRLAFIGTEELMVITVYYRNQDDDIILRSCTIGSTIDGQQVISVSFNEDISKVIQRIENILFSKYTYT